MNDNTPNSAPTGGWTRTGDDPTGKPRVVPINLHAQTDEIAAAVTENQERIAELIKFSWKDPDPKTQEVQQKVRADFVRFGITVGDPIIAQETRGSVAWDGAEPSWIRQQRVDIERLEICLGYVPSVHRAARIDLEQIPRRVVDRISTHKMLVRFNEILRHEFRRLREIDHDYTPKHADYTL